MSRLNPVAILAATLLAGACSRAPAPKPVEQPNVDAQFAALEREYVIYSMGRFPVVATYLGGSAFDPALAEIDGRLRDYSAAALQEEDARWSEFRNRFEDIQGRALSPRRKIDCSVALAQIAFLLHQHQVRRYQERALDSFIDEPFRGVDWQIQGMTATGQGTYGTDAEWQQVLARTRAIPAYLANAEQQIAAGVAAKNTPDWRTLEQFGLRSTVADAEYFSRTLPAMAQKNLPAIKDELQAAGDSAAAAYRHFRDFIATTFFDNPAKGGATALRPKYSDDRYMLGEAEYNWALKNNLRVQKSAAQLFDESWPIVEETQGEMVTLARGIATNHKWKVPDEGPAVVRFVFDRLSRDAPKTDDEMLEDYRKTGARLVDYGRRTGLFDVPKDYRLEVTVTPPPLRSGIDGAAYYPAPPFKQTGVGRFYVTPTENDPAMLREEHNRAALADLAAHEGFPGHDWHYKVMTQYRDSISPIRWLTPGAVEDSSSMWEDSMAAEGWALYSEALLAERQPGAPNGFYTPEERLYQLRGKLYRDLRVRIDTGIHTGRISFDDAVTLFSEVVDFLPGSCTDKKASLLDAKRASCGSASAAITRYSRWPTQAITYRLGKDEVLALRQRAEEKSANSFSAKRFHLEFMKQGTIPAGYFGDDMLRELTE